MKRPDYAGIQREKDRYLGFLQLSYRGRGQCSKCNSHDYHDADRFGLSHFINLGGRVGRGTSNLRKRWPTQTDSCGKDRMRIMTETTNWF